MIFNGLQKLTLLDYPGNVACTLFTSGCDFRCPFCHNASLVFRDSGLEIYSEDDILTFLKKRLGILEGVAVTGGEPLLHSDLPEFLKKVHALGYKIKLDTNGSYPERLKAVLEAGLVDMVAMDIKNSREKYGKTIGIPDYDTSPIEESVELLLKGNVDYEFRTTVTGTFHRAEDFYKIGEWLKDAKAYYLQAFVDSGELISPDVTGASPSEMAAYLDIIRKFIPTASLRGTEQ